MLFRKPPSDGRSLMVRRAPIELVLYEDGVSPLTVTLPPYEELAEIESLRGTHFSITQFAELQNEKLHTAFLSELQNLESRVGRFQRSTTFLTRLAAASLNAGDIDREGRYLEQLQHIDQTEFARNRLGEHLVKKGNLLDAERFFESLDLEKNVHANLRLASFEVTRGALDRAAAGVERALRIDPLDYAARVFDGSLKIFFGDYERAIISFRVAAEERPNSAVAATNMAVAYLRLGKTDRALTCLKRAVALDPLSETAVSLFADVANTLEVGDEAIPAMRYFVRFEQRSASMWARLGRALIHIEEYGEAIAALKRQSSVEDAADLWNNMGVAHYLRGDQKKAGEAFVHAMKVSNEPTEYAFCLAAKNAAALLMRAGNAEDALRFVDAVLIEENREKVLKREDLSQLILIRIDALNRLGRTTAANEFSEYVLSMDDASLRLRGWVASGLITQYALREDRRSESVVLAHQWKALATTLPSKKQRVQVLNNIAFAFIEGGLLHEGDEILSKISFAVFKEPYPTATLGLLHLRRGHVDLARTLYDRAIAVCNSSVDRARIRQKWHLEEASIYLESEPRKALRLLEKVWAEDRGEPLLVSKASELLKGLGLIRSTKK